MTRAGAAILAQLLRVDLLPEAWIAPPPVRQLRVLLRHRVALVRLRTLLRNRIHAIVADYGHDWPAGGYWTGPGRAWLASLALPAVSRELVSDDQGLIDALQGRIDRLDWEIHQRGRSDPRVKVLTQLPGAGPFTALVILAEVGDVSRFGSARKLASWVGLTPTVRGSDRVAHYGHISKQGSVWLRCVLCEAAQTAKRSPQFAVGFQAIAQRRGKKIATTAVARKLATRVWHLLTDAEAAASPQPAAPPIAAR
jgi:transposase